MGVSGVDICHGAAQCLSTLPISEGLRYHSVQAGFHLLFHMVVGAGGVGRFFPLPASLTAWMWAESGEREGEP